MCCFSINGKIWWRPCLMYPCLGLYIFSWSVFHFYQLSYHLVQSPENVLEGFSSPNLNPAPSHPGSKCIARDHCCCWQCFRYHSNIVVTFPCMAGCAAPGLELMPQLVEHRRPGTKTALGKYTARSGRANGDFELAFYKILLIASVRFSFLF